MHESFDPSPMWRVDERSPAEQQPTVSLLDSLLTKSMTRRWLSKPPLRTLPR
jgi:hypothetical protein